MKIGVKYCGGCNPTYDRIGIVSKIKKYICEGDSIEVAKQAIIYDIVVILCGCSKACVNHQDIEAKYEKICVTSESDIIKLAAIIDKTRIL